MPVRTRLLALLVAAALWSTVLASAVAAAEIPRLQGPVTDRVGALDGRAGEVEDAIDELLAAENVQLFVAFVSTTDDLTVTEFVDETARQNSLGANDVLLVVALDDRTDAIWVADGLDRITDREIDAIIADTLEPRLRDGDFAGAAVATARALGEAAAVGPVTPVPTQRPSDGGGTGGGGGIGLGAVIAIILVAIGIFVVGRWVLAMFANRREAEERDRRTGRLAREANALLLSTDERIRDAQQEVGFVEAAYGEREVVPLREAITAAQAELRAAFEIRQRLDDDEPEDPPTREAMLTEIVERTRGAQAALDRENERIRQLRDLERDAPAILEALPERIEAVEARLDGAERTLAGLQRYAESTWRPVGGNLVEARKGLEGARAAVRDGLAALEAGTPSVAARQVRTAQEGESGAGALIDAIDKLAQSAREAEARLPEELRSAETDLGEARQALDRANGDATLRERFGQAETSLRTAQAAATASPLDPVSALRAAVEAHRQADEVLAAVRQDAEQRAKFLAALEASFTTARADIDRAADFIAARRGGVGRRARTRLTEAERQLDHALSLRDADPQAAMAAARRAEQLAEEAYRLATQDFDDWSGGGPGSGPRRRSDTELVLGGILGGILLGGGRGGGGGWGGSPWGTPGPFGGGGGWGGGGGGRSRGGGFGGFGGGGLGGGGGRSRGGRW